MIKIATIEDYDVVLKLALEFAKHTAYKDLADEKVLSDIVKKFLTSDYTEKVIILYGEVGMLVAAKTPFLFGLTPVATEIAWWVDPEERQNGVGDALIEAYETWAEHVGCKIKTLACLDIPLGKYYEKKGYVLSEQVYYKGL